MIGVINCMRQLKIEPVIYEYDGIMEFIKSFRVGKDDLIITSKKLYDEYLKYHIKESAVIFTENYGEGYPSDNMVESIYENIKRIAYERVIAVGGNSILEIGKILALKNISPVIDLFENRLEVIKEKELVLVPTVCGTGTEITNICTLYFKGENSKRELNIDELYADSAVLIPELLESIPFNVFVENSITAFIHAVDSYLSPKSTKYTRLFSEKAIEIFLKGYRTIILKGKDSFDSLFKEFLFGSNYSGIALANTGYSIIHSIGYPLSVNKEISYKESDYAVFTAVLRMYVKNRNDININSLKILLCDLLECDENKICDELEYILSNVSYKRKISEYGIEETELNNLAVSAVEIQSANGFIKNTIFSKDEVYGLYESIY